MDEALANSQQTDDLLHRACKDAKAFDELFARHRPALRDAIQLRMDRRLQPRLDASDIGQEAQLEAFRRFEDYLTRQPMPFHVWLRKMAQERLIMARRKHLDAHCRAAIQELPFPANSSDQLAQELVGSDSTPSQHATNQELAEQVRKAMTQLPQDDREILLMRVYEGLTYEEIAGVLEIEPATARQRNGRALIRLHNLLSGCSTD